MPSSFIHALIAVVSASSLEAGTLYWTDVGSHRIQSWDLGAGSVEDLVTSDVIAPTDIAVDVVGKKIYWTESSPADFMIFRANLDGSNREALVTQLSEPSGIAVDPLEGKLYWTDVGTRKIQRANLDGTGIEDLIATGIQTPVDLVLDVSARLMYWTEASPGEYAIFRANLDGTGVEGIVAFSGGRPSGIAVDPTAGKIYWTDRDLGIINRANTDGSGQEIFLSSPSLIDPVRVALDIPRRFIYWTEASPGDFMISRSSLDDANVELLVCSLSNPSGIDIDSASTASVPTEKNTWGRLKWLYGKRPSITN